MADRPEAPETNDTTAPEEARASSSASDPTVPIGDSLAHLGHWEQLGRFHVRRALGAGGMGVVLEADDPQLERRVAIKVLHVGDGSRAEVRRGRLLREARAAARLSHPNIITIHDVGTLDDGHPFIAMELVEGQTLAQWQATPRPWREAIAIYLQAARGLAAAHQAGLVHRDFKPDNVLLGRHGAVRVSDFGIAAVSEAPEAQATSEGRGEVDEPAACATAIPSPPPAATAATAAATPALDAPADGATLDSAAAASPASSSSPASMVEPSTPPAVMSLQLTAEGEILGTPAFMAPEQRASAAVDERADQYAFCVALHHALTGELPFGDDAALRAERAAAGKLVTPRRGRPGPRALYALIERGLSPLPADRFPSMQPVIARLEATLSRRRRALVALAAGAAVALAGALMIAWLRPAAEECGGAEEALALRWSPAARVQLAAGFAASGLPDAAAVAARTGDAIDRWGREWTAAHLEACRATRVHHSADAATLARRMACLTSAREVLGGIVAAFTAADRELAGKSPELVLGLPRVADCAAPLPGNALPAGQSGEALRRQLDAADAAITIGKIDPALAAVQEVLVAARAAADRELEAIALLRLGRLQRRRGDQPAAAATLFDAAVAAEALRRDDLAAEAWAEWLYARRGRDVDPTIIADGVRRATEALQRAGNPPYLRSLLLNNQGVVLFTRGEERAADPLYREALALRERLYGPRDPRLADVLDNIGINLDRWARKETGAEQERLRTEARAFAERGLALREELLGPQHPAVARSLQNLAGMIDQQGKRQEARAMLLRALQIKEASLGPAHVELTTTLNNLADFDEQEGHLEEALAGYRRSAAITETSAGATSPQLGFPLLAVAEILEALGRPAEAAPVFRRLVTVRARPSEKRLAAARALLAEIAAGAPLPPARKELSDLLAAEREEFPADDPRRAPLLLAAARLDIRAAELPLALTRLTQVDQLLTADSSAASRADLAVTRAELERARGRTAAAALAHQAQSLCAERACETAGIELLRRAAAIR